MSWKPAAIGEREIHSQRQKAPDEGRERKKGEGISNKKKGERGGGERIFLRILSSAL